MKKVKEEFRDVKGFEGYYEVSNLGNIRSVDRFVGKNANKFVEGIPFKTPKDRYGYFRANLRKEGGRSCKLVSRLVAEAFIPNPDNKPTVNHKDGVKTNNCVSNLEWATHSENQKHKFDTGLATQVSFKNNASKLTEESLKAIRSRIGKDKDRYISLDFGVCEETVRKIRVGKTHKLK